MAKLFPLKRMALILNRLRSGHSITPEALVEYVSDRARLLDERMGSVSLRTIQRDIKTIGELFHIDIECNSSGKYQIVSRGDMADDYESLLLNFELLSSIDSDITLQKYVISEHRRPAFNTNISDLLYAIRECHPVAFDYTLVRHGGKGLSGWTGCAGCPSSAQRSSAGTMILTSRLFSGRVSASGTTLPTR